MKTMNACVGDVARLSSMIEASEFDAVIACSPENVRYTGDVMIDTQTAIRDRLAFVVWAKGQKPVYVLCQVEEGYVRQESWITEFRSYKEFVTRPIDVLADLLIELGLEKGRVGIEVEYMAALYHRQLLERLPGLTLGAAEPIFRAARMRKSAREIETLQRGFRGTEKAMFATYISTTVGTDEFSLYRSLADGILLSGADSVAFNHINAGPNTGFPHAAPTTYQVQKGDIVKADSGGYYDNYYSNVGRTARMGKPTIEEQDLWKRLRAIHHEIADMLRPGNTGRQLFERARVLHEKHDIPFPFAHNGHSIGLEAHERPLIGPNEDIPYEAGMVSTVETRVRWVGKAGYHNEDLYLITDGAPRLLSDAFDNEEILVI
ncbi:Xaa-Pro peptidase family protein [Oceaniovalibus sp. ACAM 378]|jgi:Xaa-Pro aminopeptidase|uniref:M24 family metallopeptidase n=1 Tax=Oceaniovalibus sp. ACAM 378 TaxID=2599923 RepID=UPI0011D8B425|nr:Xaa-Pro peptidase family protein [Oceaniovalibus sp. ACAM 378]TYB84544.1 aminopeptidase P family protein [Oceaniovalibus sp. ACAM 378]